MTYKAIIWDFGGVITSSPFEAFNNFESQNNLPLDTIRTINSENPDSNAWAEFERNDISVDQFDELFAKEAEKKGFNITGKQIIGLLSGKIRPFMVDFLKDLKGKYKLGCITNNVQSDNQSKQDYSKESSEAMTLFDHVIESSLIGIRKPDPRIYHMSCDALEVEPKECIYLDDLGINLKPAKAIGMTTIKVIDPNIAISQVKEFLGIR